MQSSQIFLVRHGQTAWNREGRIQGQLDVPLDNVGKKQANSIGPKFSKKKISHIYTSDLRRAQETAKPIGIELGIKPILETRLRERHLGILQGLTESETEGESAKAWTTFTKREIDTPIDQGETLRHFVERSITVLKELAAKHRQQGIIIVTHGGVIDSAYRITKNVPLNVDRGFPIANTSIHTFTNI